MEKRKRTKREMGSRGESGKKRRTSRRVTGKGYFMDLKRSKNISPEPTERKREEGGA